MTRPEALLLIGPTGAGKTPLGEALQAGRLWGRRCVHVDFGVQLRATVRGDVAWPGQQPDDRTTLAALIRQGRLLEDRHYPIADRVLRGMLEAEAVTAADLVVLNGLPRHLGQARDVEATVEVRTVVHLRAEPAVVHARIRLDSGRDRGGRADDRPDAVDARLETFRRRTAPLLDHYRARGVRVLDLDVGPTTSAEKLARDLEGMSG